MKERRKGRPKEFDPGAALDAAKGVFWVEGYAATGMDHLLRQMGVSRQSAYDTFGGKRELFMAALRSYAGKVTAEIGAVLGDAGAPPLARVRRFLDGVVERSTCNDGRGCMMTNALVELGPHDAEVRAFASEVLGRLEGAIEKLLAQARREGDLDRSHSPRALARLIVVAFEGALVMSKSDRSGNTREAIGVIKGLLS